MRRFIIDTDTASDDAIAIMMALRSDKIKVEAITVVAGNVPIEYAVQNALLSVEKANTYDVKVYVGETKPLETELVTGQFAHGTNGLSDIVLPKISKTVEQGHAVDAILDLVKNNPNEIEICAIGPLTNIAKAIMKDPVTMKLVKGYYIMGGNATHMGNITPYAEFNFYVDPQAADMVMEKAENITLLPWNTCMSGDYLSEAKMKEFRTFDIPLVNFALDITQALVLFNEEYYNETGIVIADPGIMAMILDDTICEESIHVRTKVVTDKGDLFGHQYVYSSTSPNCHICVKLNNEKFLNMLKDLLS